MRTGNVPGILKSSWNQKWWWMRISSVRSNMMRILIEKAVLQINKFVPNYMSDFPKMTKGNTSFLIWDEWAIVGKPRVIYIDSNIPSFITCGLKTMLCSTCLTAYQVKVNLTSSDMLSYFRWHGTAFVKIIYYLTVQPVDLSIRTSQKLCPLVAILWG